MSAPPLEWADKKWVMVGPRQLECILMSYTKDASFVWDRFPTFGFCGLRRINANAAFSSFFGVPDFCWRVGGGLITKILGTVA